MHRNREAWPLEAIAGFAGLFIVGAIAAALQAERLWQWHVNRKTLSNVSAATIKVTR